MLHLPRTRHLLSIGVASVLTVGGLFSLAPVVGAQLDDTAYETENGLEVTWDDAWVADEELTGYEDETERDRLVMYNDTYQFIVAEFLTDNYTVESLRDEEIQYSADTRDAEEIDSFEGDDTASVLWTEEGESDTFAVFAHVYETDRDHLVLLRVAAPVDEIADAFDSVTADIEIDNDEPFAGGDLAQADIDDVIETFDDEAGGNPNNNDEETPEADDEETSTPEADDEETSTPEDEDNGGDVDAEEYLTAVQDQYDEWSESLDRFNEVFFSGESLTQAEIEELLDVFELWSEAPDVAAELEAPEGFEELHDAYLAYADGLGAIVIAFDEYSVALEDDPDSAETDDALQVFTDALADAEDLGVELEDLLTDVS